MEGEYESTRFGSGLLVVLLVPCALIAGGAGFYALFLPKCILGGNVRTPVATAHAEMRNLAVALESYYIANGSYPFPAGADSWAVTASTEPVEGYTPRSLTTPIVYTTILPDDHLRTATVDPSLPSTFAYRYATWPRTCWILASDGPDGDADIPLIEFFSEDVLCDPNRFFIHYGGNQVLYDPSNGATSSGDVVRWGS